MLNYISTRSRPDILTYVAILSKFLKNPSEYHLQIALKILSFLNETKALVIKYEPDKDYPDLQIYCYTDASNKYIVEDEGKCTSGVSILINNCLNCSISKTLSTERNVPSTMYQLQIISQTSSLNYHLITAYLIYLRTVTLRLRNDLIYFRGVLI